MAAFIDKECALDFSSDNESELIRSETQSDKDFIDDASLGSYDSDADPRKFPLLNQYELANWKYRKIGCKFCKKQISAKNLAKHKKLCSHKHTFCTYEEQIGDKLFQCKSWIAIKEFEEHMENHKSRICQFCKKRVPHDNYQEHEVQCRVEDLQKETLKTKLKKYEKEYETNYIVWCETNNKQPKGIFRWLEDKFERKQIDQELLKFAQDEFEKRAYEAKKGKGPKKGIKRKENSDKENEVPCANEGPGEKQKTKKCKSNEDEDENSKKPSQNFQVTIHLKYTWIFTTIVKYILSTFFDGYYIPCRFTKTWPVGSGSTTLFPRPDKWSRLQWAALQKETPMRTKLRSRVRITRAKLDWEYTKIKYYDYIMNPQKKYFRKRFIKPIPLIQEFIAGKELGLGAPLHCHLYIKTKEKMYINTLRRFFRRFKFLGKSLLEHIGTLKSPRDWIKYVTKEDYNAIVRNVDKEKCNNNYIMWNFAKLSRNCNISMYSVYRWSTTGLMNKYKEIHAAYWEPIIKREAYERAMQLLDETERDDIEQIAQILLNHPKKGIYLHGDPKTGKSTTALAISKGAHYQVPEGNSTFAFHSWKNEPFILFEDISNVDFLHFRNKVNQLCDEHGLCFAQTKGSGSKLITCEKVIVTSNFLPPSETDWPGFERRFICIKYDKQAVTMDQINN